MLIKRELAISGVGLLSQSSGKKNKLVTGLELKGGGCIAII